MKVKLWDKKRCEYEVIDDLDSVYCNTFGKIVLTHSCTGEKTRYDTKLYDLVFVLK